MLNLIRNEWDKFAIGTALIGALLWGGGTLYSLNREVGVLTSEIASVRDNIDLIRESRREDYQRLTDDLDRLESDVERLQDRLRN